jgi:predicted nucleic acid-binding protein
VIVLDTPVIAELMRPSPDLTGGRPLVWPAAATEGTPGPADAVIAATTLAQGARLATRNGADFAGIGIDLINPWQQP